MALISWDISLSVGQSDMDTDHKNLMGLMNQISDAWAAGESVAEIATLFDTLLSEAQVHFRREEAMLEQLDYPRLASQKEEHGILETMICEFKADYLSKGELPPIDQDINDFLTTWLVGHIREEDLKYRALFKG